MLDQIQLQGIHYHISDSTKEYIHEKLSKFDHLHDLIIDGKIRILKESSGFKVEIDLHLKQHQIVHHETEDHLLYPAIENAIHKLKKILSNKHMKAVDHKDRKNSSHHAGLNDPPQTDEEGS